MITIPLTHATPTGPLCSEHLYESGNANRNQQDPTALTPHAPFALSTHTHRPGTGGR